MDDAFAEILELFRKHHPDLIGTTPAVPSYDLEESRRVLIKRAADDLNRALLNDDLPAIAAEMVVLIRVLMGTAIVYGIRLPDVSEACNPNGPISLPKVAETLARQGSLL